MPLNETVSGHAEGYADWNAMMPEAVSSVEVTKGAGVAVERELRDGRRGADPDGAGDRGHPVERAHRLLWRRATALLTGDADAAGGWMLAADAQRADGWRDNSQEAIGHLMVSRVWQQRGRTFTLAVSGYGGKLALPRIHHGGGLQCGEREGGGESDRRRQRDLRHRARRAQTPGVVGGTLDLGRSTRSGGMWHIYLTIPPEGGIGEGVPSQTEELDQRFGTRRDDALEQTARRHAPRSGTPVPRGVGAVPALLHDRPRARRDLRVRRSPDTTPANLQAIYVALSPVVEAHWDATASLSLGIGGRLDWIYYDTQQRTGGG